MSDIDKGYECIPQQSISSELSRDGVSVCEGLKGKRSSESEQEHKRVERDVD